MRKVSESVITCRTCKKNYRVSPSRLMTRKYCSKECAKKDNYGFKPKEKICVICGSAFTIISGTQVQKKTCSTDCNYALSRKITRKSEERRKKVGVTRKCKNCKEAFTGNGLYVTQFCSTECQYDFYRKTRTLEGNPNFRNGKYTHKNFQNRRSKTAYKHLNECKRYRKEFLKKHGHAFCEVCKVNSNGTPKHEVHHIYFASKVPKHKNLHDNRNLIMVCLECHHKFHGGNEYKEVFLQLEKERGLKELFSS